MYIPSIIKTMLDNYKKNQQEPVQEKQPVKKKDKPQSTPQPQPHEKKPHQQY